jgi:hypothetical protein
MSDRWQIIVGELRALLDKATPGPWEVDAEPRQISGDDGRSHVTDTSESVNDYADAALIVAAVNALPDLLHAIETLRMHRCRPCGCGWCCASVPTKQRGETHQRTCQPHRADVPSRTTPTGASDAD